VRAKKKTADDADTDGAYARSTQALRRRDVKHSNSSIPNFLNSKAGKARKKRPAVSASGDASTSSSSESDDVRASASESSDTSSDSEEDEDDDIAHLLHERVEHGQEAADDDHTASSSSPDSAPSGDGKFYWRHRRFVRGSIEHGRLVLECTCRLPKHSLHICRHIIAVLFSIFGIHILDVSFVHMRSMRLWHRLAVTGDIKKIPMNWDDCMLEDCQPSVLMSATCLSEYQARCPVQEAPACETLMEQDNDFDMRADTEEGSDVDDSELRIFQEV
jgi:hypothetical protein